MRIDAARTRAQLASDILLANEAADAAAIQEQALDDVILDTSAGVSEAYDSMRSYLDRLRRPAITLQRDFLASYIADMQNDDRQIAENVEAALGPVVDTDSVSGLIGTMRNRAQAIYQLAEAAGPSLPEAARITVGALAEGLLYQAGQLQGRLDAVLGYLGDGSIYAQSGSYAAGLGESRRALSGIGVDPATGVYDISGADLSWVRERDGDYWRERNRQLLERYFVLDGDGNIAGIRKGMEDRISELLDIARECLWGDGMPDEMGRLTPDERYMLIYLIAKLGPVVYAAGEEGARGLVDELGPDIADQFITWLGDRVGGGGIPLVTSNLSFTADDGVFYSMDVDGSIQKRNGFGDITELACPLLGMELDSHITTFVYNDKEYRIQVWDGPYAFNLAYGGEIGVYVRDAPTSPSQQYQEMRPDAIRESLDTLTPQQTRSIFTVYRSATGSDAPDMRITVNTGGGEHIDRNAGKGYWTFDCRGVPRFDDGRPEPGYAREDLSVSGILTFEDEGLAAAAEEALEKDGVSVQRDGSTLRIDWD